MDPDRPLFNKKLLFMKRMKTTCNYEAPELHVELFAVERGFASRAAPLTNGKTEEDFNAWEVKI